METWLVVMALVGILGMVFAFPGTLLTVGLFIHANQSGWLNDPSLFLAAFCGMVVVTVISFVFDLEDLKGRIGRLYHKYIHKG